MARGAAFGLALAIAACGGGQARPAPEAPHAEATAQAEIVRSPGRAIEAFRAAWTTSVVPGVPVKEREMTAAIDRVMRAEPRKYTAKLESCREAGALVSRIIRETRYNFILFGILAALDRPGDCWHVQYAGGMKAEVLGYLDPDTLQLLLVWRIPEG